MGKDPASGLTLLVRVGRFGPMAQIGAQDETDKPRYSKLRNDQVTLLSLARQLADMAHDPRITAVETVVDAVIDIVEIVNKIPVDPSGKIRLSRKAVLRDQRMKTGAHPEHRQPR